MQAWTKALRTIHGIHTQKLTQRTKKRRKNARFRHCVSERKKGFRKSAAYRARRTCQLPAEDFDEKKTNVATLFFPQRTQLFRQ